MQVLARVEVDCHVLLVLHVLEISQLVEQKVSSESIQFMLRELI
jgi:hypothetical protein